MKTLLLASTNYAKIQEMSAIVQTQFQNNYHIISLSDCPIPAPDEPYETFLENAGHKARYYAHASGHMVIADDSGMSIDTLDGFPGVRTREFMDECGGPIPAYSKLQALLAGIENPRAAFHSAIALFCPQTQRQLAHEEKHCGYLSFPPRGERQFGFDPIFVPDGFKQTVAELGLEIKNTISPRARALTALLHKLV
jgi:XTP/dITP diphosphohydrolase